METLIKITKTWLSQDIAERCSYIKKVCTTQYSSKYPKDMIDEFLIFWAYYEDGDETMRFEEVKGKKFHVGRRLATWFNNYKRSYKYKNSKRENKNLDFNTWARLDLTEINYD